MAARERRERRERRRVRRDARCPVRAGDPCTLCQLDVTGPDDCPLVYLVMSDDDLRGRAAAPATPAEG